MILNGICILFAEILHTAFVRIHVGQTVAGDVSYNTRVLGYNNLAESSET